MNSQEKKELRTNSNAEDVFGELQVTQRRTDNDTQRLSFRARLGQGRRALLMLRISIRKRGNITTRGTLPYRKSILFW